MGEREVVPPSGEMPLARLAAAVLRINEDLDLEAVLQGVVDGARSLTDARHSAITTLDDNGNLQNLVISGLAPDDERELLAYRHRDALFRHLSELSEPLRTSHFTSYAASAGFPEFAPHIGAFLSAPLRVGDAPVGSILVGEKHSGGEFTRNDEQMLEVFAAQAAAAINNARRYGEELRARADLEALVNTSPVGVLAFEAATGQPVVFNREMCRIVGLPHGESHDAVQVFRQLTFRRLDGSEVSSADLPLTRALVSGETVLAEEIVIELPDGTRVTTLVNVTPIRDADGNTASIVATVQDITALEETERLRAEFVGMVSHELRAPLTSIKGSAAIAQEASHPLDPAETRQFFRIIEEQADHMQGLINDLLDLSRIEAGVLSVSPEPADLAAVIEQAKNAFSSSGHRNSIEVDAEPGLPRVWADKQRVVQVLYNLFSNAARHSQPWSAITVSAAPRNLEVEVSVTDEGSGIDPERLPHVFTKFSRPHSQNPGSEPDGYGLGLAICKGIVEAHGGRIWAHSDGAGRGTRLSFTIPANDETAPTVAEPEGTERPATRPERIVALDDDPQTLRYMRRTLTDDGYSPVLTSDPAELERILMDQRTDLVLLNLVLPGTDGFEVMRQISKFSDASVIVVSGRGSDSDVARAFEMGATDYVVKPFSPSELRARISAALRRQTLSNQAKPYRFGDLTVDYIARSVSVAGRPVKLTPTQHRLLVELCSNAGRALTYDQLLERIWGTDSSNDVQRVRTLIKELRRKLGDSARHPQYILTEPGVGYRAAHN